jgi:hypothetical protein
LGTRPAAFVSDSDIHQPGFDIPSPFPLLALHSVGRFIPPTIHWLLGRGTSRSSTKAKCAATTPQAPCLEIVAKSCRCGLLSPRLLLLGTTFPLLLPGHLPSLSPANPGEHPAAPRRTGLPSSRSATWSLWRFGRQGRSDPEIFLQPWLTWTPFSHCIFIRARKYTLPSCGRVLAAHRFQDEQGNQEQGHQTALNSLPRRS